MNRHLLSELIPRGVALTLVLAALSLVLGWTYLQLLLLGGTERWVIAHGFVAPLVVGLWLRLELARKVAVACLVFAAMVLPLGLLGPFAAMDAGPNFDWKSRLPIIVPCIGAALLMAHILGKRRDAFRSLRSLFSRAS